MNNNFLKYFFAQFTFSASSKKTVVGLALVLTGFTLGIILDTLTSTRSEDLSQISEDVFVEEVINPFKALSLNAEAVFVWDITHQEVLYSNNAETQLPLASLAKIMTALIVAESLSLDDIITVSPQAISQEGNSTLSVGERWSVRDLIDFTLLTSSNDGASALASAVSALGQGVEEESLFIQKIKVKIKEIGLPQTFFLNESGLDVTERLSGVYGSARDVAMFFSYTLKNHPSLLEATAYVSQDITSEDGFIHSAYNTNKIIETLPSVIASKTGFTDIAGGNLVVAFEAGPTRPIVVVVLGSTRDDRFTDVEQLIWASLEYLKQ